MNTEWFLLDPNELPLEVNLIKASTKKKTKSTGDKLAALQLQLETQELLAEIGDADAIQEVKELKAKIEALKKKQ